MVKEGNIAGDKSMPLIEPQCFQVAALRDYPELAEATTVRPGFSGLQQFGPNPQFATRAVNAEQIDERYSILAADRDKASRRVAPQEVVKLIAVVFDEAPTGPNAIKLLGLA